MSSQGSVSSLVLFGLVFLTGSLSGQPGPTLVADPRETVEVLPGEIESSQCEAADPQSEELPLVFEKQWKDAFECFYCETCAGQLVNKACCFDGSGNAWCVGQCSTGCVPGGGGPDYPTPGDDL